MHQEDRLYLVVGLSKEEIINQTTISELKEFTLYYGDEEDPDPILGFFITEIQYNSNCVALEYDQFLASLEFYKNEFVGITNQIPKVYTVYTL